MVRGVTDTASELDPRLGALIEGLPEGRAAPAPRGQHPPELALRLARRHGRGLPGMAEGAAGLRSNYRFASFSEFVRMYIAISACLVDAEEACGIAVALAAQLAAQQVVYAEVTFTAMTHVARGVDPAAMLAGLAEGRVRARELHGVELAWVFDIVRSFGDQAAPTLEAGVARPRAGCDRPRLRRARGGGLADGSVCPVFTRARAEGLRSLPHAGEMAGPRSIWEALRVLGADRIGHGVRAVEDPELMAYLQKQQVPLRRCARRATWGSGCTRIWRRIRCRSCCALGWRCRWPATIRRC